MNQNKCCLEHLPEINNHHVRKHKWNRHSTLTRFGSKWNTVSTLLKTKASNEISVIWASVWQNVSESIYLGEFSSESYKRQIHRASGWQWNAKNFETMYEWKKNLTRVHNVRAIKILILMGKIKIEMNSLRSTDHRAIQD